MEKIGNILSKKEIERLREILNKEYLKQKNSKYSASLLMYIQDLEKVSFHEHYLSLIYFLKYYKMSIDMDIKFKLKTAFENRTFDFERYKKSIKQSFYRYRKKDYPLFLKKAEYFFGLYKGPFNLKNMKNEDYLNRVYLGLGFEFLLKAIFLKNGYVINKICKKGLCHPVKQKLVLKKDISAKVYEFGYFIDSLSKIKSSKIDDRDFNYYLMCGLIICQNWRNQDIHTPTSSLSSANIQEDCIKTAYYSLYQLFLKKHKVPKFPK